MVFANNLSGESDGNYVELKANMRAAADGWILVKENR